MIVLSNKYLFATLFDHFMVNISVCFSLFDSSYSYLKRLFVCLTERQLFGRIVCLFRLSNNSLLGTGYLKKGSILFVRENFPRGILYFPGEGGLRTNCI